MRNTKTAWFVILLALAFAFPALAAHGPLEEVRSSVDAIVEMLKDDAISPEEKKDRVGAMVRERFDFQIMAQGILATNWKRASKEQRQRFIDLFTELIETTYRDRIDAYNNERVDYVSEKIHGRKAEVQTLVITKEVEIPVDYKLVQRGGGWLAYDIVIEGVSLVRNYRDSYKDIVRKEGIDGLLSRLEKKIEEARNAPPAEKAQ